MRTRVSDDLSRIVAAQAVVGVARIRFYECRDGRISHVQRETPPGFAGNTERDTIQVTHAAR